ncbi:MAG TPA: hypothetical protein VKT17_08760 [Acidobacteriota bacterium]|nr:hypothetical protein [Acidobacteriota bacterium]
MITRFAVPFLILAVLFLPLPFVLSAFVFAVLLAIRPRGEPGLDFVLAAGAAGPCLLRSPPR